MTSIARERELYARVGFTHRLREQWGASFVYTTDRPLDEPATRLFLHISVTNPSSYPSNDAHARAIEDIGKQRFPNTGISYNEMIMPGGLLYEGQPMGRRGAHTLNDFTRPVCTTLGCPGRGFPLTAPSWNLNVNGRACCLARNIDDAVTDADVIAAARWGAAGKLAGLVDDGARWHGHRCVAAKDCPGGRGWVRLDDIADLTADYVRRGHVALEDDDMQLDDRISLVDSAGERKLAGQILGVDSITVGQALGYSAAALWYSRRTLLPLVQAAAEGRPLSAEQVQEIALAAAAAIPDGFADEVADELGDRLDGQP